MTREALLARAFNTAQPSIWGPLTPSKCTNSSSPCLKQLTLAYMPYAITSESCSNLRALPGHESGQCQECIRCVRYRPMAIGTLDQTKVVLYPSALATCAAFDCNRSTPRCPCEEGHLFAQLQLRVAQALHPERVAASSGVRVAPQQERRDAERHAPPLGCCPGNVERWVLVAAQGCPHPVQHMTPIAVAAC